MLTKARMSNPTEEIEGLISPSHVFEVCLSAFNTCHSSGSRFFFLPQEHLRSFSKHETTAVASRFLPHLEIIFHFIQNLHFLAMPQARPVEGADIARVHCSAEKSPNGQHFTHVLAGVKCSSSLTLVTS